MEVEGVYINVNVFEVVVEVMVKVGDIEGVLVVFEKVEEKFVFVLYNFYNFLMEWYKSKDMLFEVEDIFNCMKEKKC